MYFFDKTTWRKSWNHPPGSPLVTNLTKWIFQSLCWDFQCIFVVKPLKIVCWPGCQKDQYPWNWLSLRGWPVLCCTWPSIVFWWPKTISKSNNLLMTPYFWKKTCSRCVLLGAVLQSASGAYLVCSTCYYMLSLWKYVSWKWLKTKTGRELSHLPYEATQMVTPGRASIAFTHIFKISFHINVPNTIMLHFDRSLWN